MVMRANRLSEQVGDGLAFFEQFGFGGFGFGKGVVAEFETFDNLPVACAIAGEGEAIDKIIHDAVGVAIGQDGGAEPIACGCGCDEGTNGIEGGAGSAGGATLTTRFDDLSATLLVGGHEVALKPGTVGDDIEGGFAINEGVLKVGELGGTVVAPDTDIGDLGGLYACSSGDLGFGAIFIEAGHGEPTVCGHVGGVAKGDEGIGVAGIGDDDDAHIIGGAVVDGLTLTDEDCAIGADEIAALHACLTGHTTDEQCPVDAIKGDVGVITGDDALKEGLGAVVEFHDDAFKRLHCLGDFQNLEDDGLVSAEDFTIGETEE